MASLDAPSNGTTGPTGSLIPPESAQRVGQPLGEPVEVTIEAREAQRYAYAVGDENPIYFDPEAARAAGYRGLVAPPTFISHATVGPRSLGELMVDGLWRRGEGIRLEVARVMFGGEEWDFLEPVCVGDRITAQTRLADLDQKAGTKGPFVRIVRETTYTRADGAVVARSRQIGIAR
ncbi:MAG: MaoC family dehydratase N-terminal domain-containing protein [Acidimicrobiales bacterium]